ncbi:ABC transporter permease [Demequina mangrovi]|uniref:Peptide/nickel transport system permease protein n=1 Tax=Demequina mangrovi TaxID=1043493 RepID=A0A1H6Y9M0_9MICO|nr:ABC transporter permease [Demequina mangrovi]SEJ37186.1 peptide/nickel transport system permease protein [Demequina mangrovi]
MAKYLAKRLGSALLVLFALSLLSFGMVRMMPGDPALQYLNIDNPDPNQLAEVRAELGLDRPWTTQYLEWAGGILTGDFGSSMTKSQEIGTMLGDRFPVSLQLAIIAVIVGLVIGLPSGVVSAVRQGTPLDAVIRGGSFLALSVPAFAIGAVVIMVNALTLKLPLIGYTPWAQDPLGSILSLLVPALVLSLAMSAVISRYSRGTVLDTLSQDYIRTARSKGVPTGRIVRGHALRNALIPVTTVVGIQLAALIGGTVVIESIFTIPGMGSMLIEAINSSDYPTIQACVLVLGACFVIINLVVDLLYPVIDPRVRAS